MAVVDNDQGPCSGPDRKVGSYPKRTVGLQSVGTSSTVLFAVFCVGARPFVVEEVAMKF